MKSKRSIFVILIAAFLIGSCASAPEDTKAPEDRLFAKAEKKFQQQSYNKALELYNRYLSEFPDGPSAAAALMREGEIYKARGDYATARKAYLYLIQRYARNALVSEAVSEVLDTLGREGAYDKLIRQADSFLRQPELASHAASIYGVLGDAYMAKGLPVSAVYFYARAGEEGKYADREQSVAKLKSAARKLSESDIMTLLERIKDPTSRGYLMYQLGLKAVEEEQHDDGLRILSQFADMFPGHEYEEQARHLIREIEAYYRQAGYGEHTIGCLLPLSGAYKVYGNRALRGIELALDQANVGNEVSIVIRDTGSDADQAASAVETLARKNVSAIIGPIITAESAASKAQDYGVPIVTLTQKPGITEIGDYVFRNFLTPRMQVRAVVSYATERLGVRTFGVFYPDEKYGRTFMTLFQDEVAAQGGVVTSVASYPVRQTDFSGPIRRLARKRDFEALFIPDAPRKTGLIIPQLAFHEVNNIYLLGTNLWHSEKLIRMARRFAQGAIVPDVFFPGSRSQAVADFIRTFKENFGEAPGFIEALAYDTAMILLGIFRNPDVRSPVAVRDALTQMHDFQGVTGMTSFIPSGEAEKALYLLRIEGDHFVESD